MKSKLFILACACLFSCNHSNTHTLPPVAEKCVSAEVKEITSLTFENEVLNAKEDKVLMEVYANWCGPCQMMMPIIQSVADETCGQYKVVKLDSDKDFVISNRFDIRSIPTMIVFRHGYVKKTLVGYHTKEEVMEMFE